MKKLNFRPLIGMLAFASIFFLAFGCNTEEVVPSTEEGLKPALTTQTQSLNGLEPEIEVQETSSLLECCQCMMSVTNLSPIYTTAVILQPSLPNPTVCVPLFIQSGLPPGATSSTTGNAWSEMQDGEPDIFILNAENVSGGGQSDCVRLRVVIDCGKNVYDQIFLTDPHPIGSPMLYHVAQFGFDFEGNTDCSLVPLNQSFRCRNSENQVDCLPECIGVSTGG